MNWFKEHLFSRKKSNDNKDSSLEENKDTTSNLGFSDDDRNAFVLMVLSILFAVLVYYRK